MSTADTSECAACGKEGGDNLRTCKACKLVKYCNVTCQKSHRPKHKKECRKRAAELFDEALFQQPPPKEECPICCLHLPMIPSGSMYQVCCGKTLCCGCIHADTKEDGSSICPFCRGSETTSDEDLVELIKKRAEADDADAIHMLGYFYVTGKGGLPKDSDTALALWHRSGDLGYVQSYCSLANEYWSGQAVESDRKKAKYYWALAAMRGDAMARNNLGIVEGSTGNMDRAMKHFMIAAGDGYEASLKKLRDGFMKGFVTKDDYEKALRAQKESMDEIRSEQRDNAAAFRDQFHYY